MKLFKLLASVVIGVASLLGPINLSAQSCSIVDLMPEFWRVVDRSGHESPLQQVEDFRSRLVQGHGDLYFFTGVGFKSDEELDRAILKALTDARAHPEAIRAMSVLLRDELSTSVRAFTGAFSDFRCNFSIYLLPALGKLDGAGRVINHAPALIFGVDNIAAEYSPKTLPIFLDHEFFHRYHDQVAGFSDDRGEQEILWRAIWAEGLATYVSKMLNPSATMQDALILPKDLVQRAQPQISILVGRLLPMLDERDPEVFSVYFKFHSSETPVPPRVGYYLGALAAERLSEHYSLFALAHLPPETVRPALSQVLDKLRRDSQLDK